MREHRNSIRQTNNLDVADFHFTVVAMAVDLVAWGESVLIRHFRPVWCSIISGFGIHAPGKGRVYKCDRYGMKYTQADPLLQLYCPIPLPFLVYSPRYINTVKIFVCIWDARV